MPDARQRWTGYPHVISMSRTLRDDTFAVLPGSINLSRAKLARLQPQLLSPLHWFFTSKRMIQGHKRGRSYLLTHVKEHLMLGASNAAVVVSLSSLRIAAFSSDIDCVALLHFAPSFARDYQLTVGQRLLSINTYAPRSAGIATDLREGPHATGRWGNFAPYIAELLSDDAAMIEDRKSRLGPEYDRAAELVPQWLARHGSLARDGRPLFCNLPAHLR